MNEDKFKPGDVVRVKGIGGRSMIVNGYHANFHGQGDGDRLCVVYYWSDTGVLMASYLREECLELVPEPEGLGELPLYPYHEDPLWK